MFVPLHRSAPKVCVVTQVPFCEPGSPAADPAGGPWLTLPVTIPLPCSAAKVGQAMLTRHCASSAIPQTSVERAHAVPFSTPCTGVGSAQTPIISLAVHL